MEKFLEIKKDKLGIGTWKMGEIPENRNEEIASIRYALENGIKLIDTAEMYGNGMSEKLISEAIKGFDRDNLFLVSKVLPNNAGKRNIFKSCEKSLKNLDVDYLDLYLLHWRGSTPFEETIDCMEELKKEGKIRNWGVSNMDIDDMQEILAIKGGKNCLVNQVLYHLGSKGIEYSLKPFTDKNNITTMAYCPLAQGGRLKNQLLSSKSVKGLSKKYSISEIQVLLVYMLEKENTISIPKASKLKHMKEIVSCKDIHFLKEDILLLESEYPRPNRKLPLDIE